MLKLISRARGASRFLLGALVAMGVGFAAAAPAEEPVYLSYETLRELPPVELATVQIKLTYMGPQYSIIPSLLFYVDGEPPNVQLFTPFWRKDRRGVNYSNDSSIAGTAIDTAELTSLLTRIGTLPKVTDGDVSGEPGLAISILVRYPTVRVFDSVLNQQEARPLIDQMRAGLAGNRVATDLLARQACTFGMTGDVVAKDLTASCRVKFGGLRQDPKSKRFHVAATVTNISAVPLPSPVSLVVEGLKPNASLVNLTGVTCEHEPMGTEYIDIEMSSGGLPSNQSVEVELEIDNPDLATLELTAAVLGGPGDR